MRLKCITANGVAVYIDSRYYADKCTKFTSNVYIYTFETGAVMFCSFEPITTVESDMVDNYVAEHQLIECDTGPKDDLRLWKRSVD